MTNARPAVLSLVLIAGAMLGGCGADTSGKTANAQPAAVTATLVRQPQKKPETPAQPQPAQTDPLKPTTASPQPGGTSTAVQPPPGAAATSTPEQSPASTGAQPAPAKAATTPAPAPAPAASNDQTLLIFLAATTIFMAVITVLAVLLASRMLSWRRRLPDGQVSLVPEKLLDQTDQLAELNLRQMQSAEVAQRAYKDNVAQLNTTLATGVEGFKTDVSEINKAFAVFAATAADKDAQIKRLREGSDKQVYRQFFRHFIKVMRYVEADAAEARAKGEDATKLEGIQTYLMEALAESGLETYSPPEGEDYRKRNDIADGPKTVKTDDPARDWTISRTIQPGFRMPTGADPLVIEKAVVEIYRLGA